jgi:hypothetical protein
MSTGFQFAHIDWFSSVGAQKSRATGTSNHGTQRGRGWTNVEILAEATREPGHCSHVQHPAPPTICQGSIEQVIEAIGAYVESQNVTVRLKGSAKAVRKARSDSPSMAAGVISFPQDRMDEWPAFRDHAIRQLEKRYRDRLRCVLEHLDERHPHVHFYLVPRPGESFGVVHDGYEASRDARKKPGNKIRSAFNRAMAMWQDWVQEAICGPFALARLGPGRRRLSRRQWELEQQAAEDEIELSRRRSKIDADRAEADRDRYQLDWRRRQLDIEQKVARAKVAEAHGIIEKTRAELERIYTALTEQQRAAVRVDVPSIEEVLAAGAGRSLRKIKSS